MKFEAIHIINNSGRDGYSITAKTADGVWERCEIEIPDSLICGYNYLGEPLLEIDGQTICLATALHSWGGEPCIEWIDGAKFRRMMVSRLPDYAAKVKKNGSEN